MICSRRLYIPSHSISFYLGILGLPGKLFGNQCVKDSGEFFFSFILLIELTMDPSAFQGAGVKKQIDKCILARVSSVLRRAHWNVLSHWLRIFVPAGLLSNKPCLA